MVGVVVQRDRVRHSVRALRSVNVSGAKAVDVIAVEGAARNGRATGVIRVAPEGVGDVQIDVRVGRVPSQADTKPRRFDLQVSIVDRGRLAAGLGGDAELQRYRRPGRA